jgi:hypothetical protein
MSSLFGATSTGTDGAPVAAVTAAPTSVGGRRTLGLDVAAFDECVRQYPSGSMSRVIRG